MNNKLHKFEKRSVTVANLKATVSMEKMYWKVLEKLAANRGSTAQGARAFAVDAGDLAAACGTAQALRCTSCERRLWNPA